MSKYRFIVSIDVSAESLEHLRALVSIPHEHYDGMNECRICDTPIIDAAIETIERLQKQLKEQNK